MPVPARYAARTPTPPVPRVVYACAMCAIHEPWLKPNTTRPFAKLALAGREPAAERVRRSAEADRPLSKMARALLSHPSLGGAQSRVSPCGVVPDQAALPAQPQKWIFMLS